MAIGASPLRLAGLWVVEATAVGGGGALLGWTGAAPLARRVGARLVGGGLDLPVESFLPYLLLAATVCALVALVPATWAARQDPTTVLRET